MATTLVLSVAMSRSAHGAVPPRGFEPVLAEADEHASAGRHDAALRSYAEAFELMPPETRASDVGEFVALAVGQAAVMDYQARGDAASLELGREVIGKFIAAVEAGSRGGKTTVDAAKYQLSEIEKLMPKEVPPPAEDVGVEPNVEPKPEPRPIVEDANTSAAPTKLTGMGKAGLALSVAGGAGAVIGVTLVVLPDEELSTGDRDAANLRSTKNPGWGVLGGGAATLVVGVVLLGVDRARAKRRVESGKPRAVVHPWFGPRGAGLGVVGRF